MQRFLVNISFIFVFLSLYTNAQNPVQPPVQAARDTSFLVSLPELRLQIDELLNDPNFAEANWGVYIQSLKTGEIIYKTNADKLFIPASSLKLFTSAAGFLLLGSDYQFLTTLSARGKVENNLIKGDLIVKGFGDPTISGKFYNRKITKVFEDWADSLIIHGINEITGNILADDRMFLKGDYTSAIDRNYTDNWFSVAPGALCFNDNVIEMEFEGLEFNKPPRINIKPDTRYYTFMKKSITGYQNSDPVFNIFRNEGSRVVTIEAKVPEKEITRYYYPVEDPSRYFVYVLKEVFEKKGIRVRGYVSQTEKETDIPDSTHSLLFIHRSYPLKSIIFEMNKHSNNLYAEQLIRTIGLEINEFGSFENGSKAMKGLLEVMGINSQNMIIDDGSGLSRLNLITPKQMVKLLNYMYVSDEFKNFYNSLPIGGIDGTLVNHFKKTRAENNVRCKPGYLPGVRSLAGYIKSADNEPFAFCIFVNNFLVPEALASNIQDAICVRLANFKRK